MDQAYGRYVAEQEALHFHDTGGKSTRNKVFSHRPSKSCKEENPLWMSLCRLHIENCGAQQDALLRQQGDAAESKFQVQKAEKKMLMRNAKQKGQM